MTLLCLYGLIAGEAALLRAAHRNGLRGIHFAIVGGAGYLVAWIIGISFGGVVVGEKAPLGLGLGWIAACYAAIVFLRSVPEQPEEATGAAVAAWALCWRATVAVAVAWLCGNIADVFVFVVAGFLGLTMETPFLHPTALLVYIATCVVLSAAFFSRLTKRRLGSVHSALSQILRQLP